MHKHFKNYLVATFRLFLAIFNCSESHSYSACQMRASGICEPWLRLRLRRKVAGEAPEGEPADSESPAPTSYGLYRFHFALALTLNTRQGPEGIFQFSFIPKTSRSKTTLRHNSMGEEQARVGNFMSVLLMEMKAFTEIDHQRSQIMQQVEN